MKEIAIRLNKIAARTQGNQAFHAAIHGIKMNVPSTQAEQEQLSESEEKAMKKALQDAERRLKERASRGK